MMWKRTLSLDSVNPNFILSKLVKPAPKLDDKITTAREIRLLIVDDDPAFCDALQTSLNNASAIKYHVTIAASTRAARTLSQKTSFDLLLINHRLETEGADGIQLMNHLLQANPDSAAIILTDSSNHADGLRALQAGADDYWPKIADWQTLVNDIAIRLGLLVKNRESQRRRLKELESLVTIQNAIIGIESEADLTKVLDSLVQLAMQILPNVDAITIFYIDRETNEPKFGAGAGVQNIAALQRHPPNLQRVLPLLVPHFALNAPKDALVKGNFVKNEKIASVAVFPLTHSGERFGLMFFNYRQPQEFNDDERSELTLLAQPAALAIHKAVLYDETKRRQQRLETIARIMPIVSATLDPEQVVRAVLTEILKVVPRARQASMLYYEQKTGDLTFSLASFEFYHIDVAGQQGRTRIQASEESIAMRVARSGKALNVPNVSADPGYLQLVSATKSALCVPILVGGEVLGVLDLESNQYDAFTPDDQLLLQALADQVAVALKKAQEHTQLLKTQDDLAANDAIAWMGLFGSNWSHSVNQRTFEIEGNVFLLRQALSTIMPPDAEKWLNDIEQASHQLKALQIAGKVTHEPKPGASTVELDRVLRERVPRWCEKFPAIHLSLELGCPQVHVPIDEGWLEIPLEKLISNALKAMGGAGTLLVRSMRYGNKVEVQVHDTGKGIPEEARNLLFKRPVPKPTAREGSGLGLLIARKVLTAHGGDLVLLRTAPNEGTAFMFHLPVVENQVKGA